MMPSRTGSYRHHNVSGLPDLSLASSLRPVIVRIIWELRTKTGCSPDYPDAHSNLYIRPSPLRGEHRQPRLEAQCQARTVAERQTRNPCGFPQRGHELRVLGIERDYRNAEPFNLKGDVIERLPVFDHLADSFRQVDGRDARQPENSRDFLGPR